MLVMITVLVLVAPVTSQNNFFWLYAELEVNKGYKVFITKKYFDLPRLVEILFFV